MSAVLAPLRRRLLAPPSSAEQRLRVVGVPVLRHTLAYALVMIVLLGGIVFGAVALNALAAGTAVEARELDAHVSQAERNYAQLVADVAALEDPGRVRQAALELGLVPSRPMRFVALERNLPADGAVTGERTNPSVDRPADPLKSLLTLER